MKKRVYSVVLSDNIVALVDELAYEREISRSSLINQILAESLSYKTPEEQITEVFQKMEQLMEPRRHYKIQRQASKTMIVVSSAVRFKYNPTVRYTVKLYRAEGDVIGEFKARFRTQSDSLLRAFTEFYDIWRALEKKHVEPELSSGEFVSEMKDGGYVRNLYLFNEEKITTTDTYGEAIENLVSTFDECLKEYFFALEKGVDPAQAIAKIYEARLKSGVPMI